MAYEFTGQQEFPGLIVLQPTTVLTPVDGSIWKDAATGSINIRNAGSTTVFGGGSSVNITTVTATNPTTATDLMTYAFPAGALNVLKKGFNYFGSGTYTTAAGQTPTLKLEAFLGSLSLGSYTTAALTASQHLPWQIRGIAVTTTVGASGALQAKFTLSVIIGTATFVSVADVNVAAVSTVDLTAAATFKLQATLSTSNAANLVDQSLLTISPIG